MSEREAVARDLATMLGKDRWVPATAHIVLLIIVLLDAGTGLPRAFKLTWATTIIATILLRTILATRAQRPDTDPVTTVRITRVLMVTLGLTWGVGAAIARAHRQQVGDRLVSNNRARGPSRVLFLLREAIPVQYPNTAETLSLPDERPLQRCSRPRRTSPAATGPRARIVPQRVTF